MGATVTRDEALAAGRTAFAAKAWTAARTQLTAADALGPLDPADLERLAEAAYLVGDEEAAVATLVRAHQAWLAAGRPDKAVKPAFWIGITLELRGDAAQASGWLVRGQRLVDQHGDCVEAGYLLFFAGMGQLERVTSRAPVRPWSRRWPSGAATPTPTCSPSPAWPAARP